MCELWRLRRRLRRLEKVQDRKLEKLRKEKATPEEIEAAMSEDSYELDMLDEQIRLHVTRKQVARASPGVHLN